jgi:hypothetical protein
MLKKIIALILIVVLIVFATFYFLKTQDEKRLEVDDSTEMISSEEEVLEIEDPFAEWDTFVNTTFRYTMRYPSEWEIDADDLERIWIYIPEEDASILFASEIATQTGFPEYEMLSNSDIAIDGVGGTISLLQDEDTRAILSVFQSESFPHFVMITYQYESEEHDEKMMSLSEDFLRRITFQ